LGLLANLDADGLNRCRKIRGIDQKLLDDNIFHHGEQQLTALLSSNVCAGIK